MVKSMTGAEAIALLYRAWAELPPMLREKTKLLPDRSMRDAETSDDDYNPKTGTGIEFRVGYKELADNLDGKFDVARALVPVVNLYHEVYGHGGQILCEFDKDTLLAQVLALSHYGCKASFAYYGFDGKGRPTRQYYRQPREIAAQYMGIKGAYEFLGRVYGEKDAGGMMSKYIRFRILGGGDCLGLKLGRVTVENTLESMNQVFVRSMDSHRRYDPGNRLPDDLRNYAKWVRRPGLPGIVRGCADGARQDLMMMAVYLRLHDQDLRVQSRRAVRMLPCSVDEAFDTSVPLLQPRPFRPDLELGQLEIVAQSVSDRGKNGDKQPGE